MHFQALSIGIQVPTHHFNGTVHSVFHQACNMRLESHALLTLLPSEKDNVPHGIRLNTFSQPVFQDLIGVGQSVSCRGGILRIGGSDFSVDLRTARPWHIELKGLHIDLRRPAQARSWAAAWAELKTSQRKCDLSKILEVVSSPKEQSDTPVAMEFLPQLSTHLVTALLRATRTFQLEDARAAIRSLIGLGLGLTPSGDDFLVGYLAGLWSTAGSGPIRAQFLSALDSELSETAQNTNEISRAYLRSAAKGQFSEPIAKLAQQLKHANNMSGVRAATQAALQVGHTSGTAGVLGLLLGCLVWQSPAPHLVFNDLFMRLFSSIDPSAMKCGQKDEGSDEDDARRPS